MEELCKENNCDEPNELCKGGHYCLNIKLPSCKYALIRYEDEIKVNNETAGAYILNVPKGNGPFIMCGLFNSLRHICRVAN